MGTLPSFPALLPWPAMGCGILRPLRFRSTTKLFQDRSKLLPNRWCLQKVLETDVTRSHDFVDLSSLFEI